MSLVGAQPQATGLLQLAPGSRPAHGPRSSLACWLLARPPSPAQHGHCLRPAHQITYNAVHEGICRSEAFHTAQPPRRYRPSCRLPGRPPASQSSQHVPHPSRCPALCNCAARRQAATWLPNNGTPPAPCSSHPARRPSPGTERGAQSGRLLQAPQATASTRVLSPAPYSAAGSTSCKQMGSMHAGWEAGPGRRQGANRKTVHWRPAASDRDTGRGLGPVAAHRGQRLCDKCSGCRHGLRAMRTCTGGGVVSHRRGGRSASGKQVHSCCSSCACAHTYACALGSSSRRGVGAGVCERGGVFVCGSARGEQWPS